MKRDPILLALPVVVLFACTKEKPKEATTTAAQSTASARPSAPTTEEKPRGGAKPAFVVSEGLSTPESVLYDPMQDLYLVSNIDGRPLAVDGNGYISQLSPDGKVVANKWIEGGRNGVTLNAPKGTALSGETLYVADIDTVRMFHRKSGAPAGEVKVSGATFLNDIALAPDGRILVSDSGEKSSAVYAIDAKKKVTTISKSDDLGRPNGLLGAADRTWVVSLGSGELYALDAKGKRSEVQKLPKGSLDGIVRLPGGDLLVSSWDAKGVYRGKPGAGFQLVIEGVESPADIGYDDKRGRLLVPSFNENEVHVYDVK